MWTWMLLACVAPSPSETESSPTETESETELDTEEDLPRFLDLEEVEPNDVGIIWEYGQDPTMDMATADGAQDVGVVRCGRSLLYTITGAMTWNGKEGDYVHDVDGFAFELARRSWLEFTLSWELETSDLDVVLYNSEGVAVDYSASFDNPEESHGFIQPAEEQFYLVVLGYMSATPENADDYVLHVECWYEPEELR